MPNHPDFYTDLLRRRFMGRPPLTLAERTELDLHLLVCSQCNYDYAALLVTQAPDRTAHYLEQFTAALDADTVTPYLRDLARDVRPAPHRFPGVHLAVRLPQPRGLGQLPADRGQPGLDVRALSPRDGAGQSRRACARQVRTPFYEWPGSARPDLPADESLGVLLHAQVTGIPT